MDPNSLDAIQRSVIELRFDMRMLACLVIAVGLSITVSIISSQKGDAENE